MNRPASALQKQRPGTAQMRRRLSLSAQNEQGLSPWSDVSSHGDRGGQEPVSQKTHSRPTTAKKSLVLARYLDEDMDASLAPGLRREFRPPPDGAVSYPLGTSPVHSKVNKIERVRTENGWLREEVEKLRMQLAAETQMHQYRAHAASQEKQALEAKLVQAEQATAAALKKVSEGSGRVKRREGMVHQVRHEEQRRRLVLFCAVRVCVRVKGLCVCVHSSCILQARCLLLATVCVASRYAQCRTCDRFGNESFSACCTMSYMAPRKRRFYPTGRYFMLVRFHSPRFRLLQHCQTLWPIPNSAFC
jgi:hypothetical protein